MNSTDLVKKEANMSAFIVADIKTMVRSDLSRTRSFKMIRRKSESRLRSWTSSRMTWDTSRSNGSFFNLRSKMPVVQNSSLVLSLARRSSRIWYLAHGSRVEEREGALLKKKMDCGR